MNTIIERFNKIKLNISKTDNAHTAKIVAVSKTFPLSHVMPLIDFGHNHYGENKVQEADAKWRDIKKVKKNLQLHLIGKLQSNKAKKAVEIFDYIHSVDSQKLADTLSKHQINLNRNLEYFIQVNIANETQKSGISVSELDAFYNYCVNEINLKIIGLMLIPPINQNVDKYFKSLSELNKSMALENMSMGMSADYLEAIKYGSTFVRVGSSIFGSRS